MCFYRWLLYRLEKLDTVNCSCCKRGSTGGRRLAGALHPHFSFVCTEPSTDLWIGGSSPITVAVWQPAAEEDRFLIWRCYPGSRAALTSRAQHWAILSSQMSPQPSTHGRDGYQAAVLGRRASLTHSCLPSTSDCDLIWQCGLCRCNWLR